MKYKLPPKEGAADFRIESAKVNKITSRHQKRGLRTSKLNPQSVFRTTERFIFAVELEILRKGNDLLADWLVTPLVPASILQIIDSELILSGEVAVNCSTETSERKTAMSFDK